MSLRRPSFEDDSASRDVNISPLIDVMFILLIFFVVTMVFSEKSVLGIERPKSDAAEALDAGAANIFIDRDGRITYAGIETGLDGLRAALSAASKKAAVIDADGALGLSRLVEVMDVCRECGIDRVFIAADNRGARDGG